MPAVEGGWNELGHIPCPAGSGEKEPILADAGGNADASWVHHIDLAETAYQIARDRAALRLHPSLRSRLPAGGPIDELFKYAADLDAPTTATLWRDLLNVARGTLADDQPELKATLSQLAGISNGLLCEPYPDGEGVVLATRKRLFAATTWYLPSLDEGDDEISRTRRERPVRLADHTKHVVKVLAASLSPLPLDTFTNALKHAALLHDLGKADERFQAMLLRTDRTDCWLLTGLTSSLLAKSDGLPQTRVQQRIACQRAGLPESFRHEMLSVQLAQRAPDLPEDPLQRDLVFHLIAAHHGYARPFAPVVFDDHPPDVKVHGISMSGTNRLAGPAHRLDSGIAERFFSLTRHYGWWGLAYLESLLRLADQQASAAEDSGTFTETPIERTTESRA
jgi:CRISPR-associated endonuclease/helicase Cas3